MPIVAQLVQLVKFGKSAERSRTNLSQEVVVDSPV
jgi:hypothetical protein